MNWIIKVFTSSIGKKIVMSLTGLFLCSFLVVHLSGNFLLFNDDGGEAFNAYSAFMSHNPVIKVFEYGLIIGFLFHIINGIILTKGNKVARPIDYKVNNANQNSSFASRHMPLTGIIILLFLILHLKTFFIEYRLLEASDSIYDTVITSFKQWWYSGIYVVAMVLLGVHLSHGFKSGFQTLGLEHKKYSPIISLISILFSIIITIGFLTMPIYFYLIQFMQ